MHGFIQCRWNYHDIHFLKCNFLELGKAFSRRCPRVASGRINRPVTDLDLYCCDRLALKLFKAMYLCSYLLQRATLREFAFELAYPFGQDLRGDFGGT